MTLSFSAYSRRPKLCLWLAILFGASLVFLVPFLQRSLANLRFGQTMLHSSTISYPHLQRTPNPSRGDDHHPAVGRTKSPKHAILTLFTSFKESPNREPVHRSTIENWSKLRPLVQPVLYSVPSIGTFKRNNTLEQYARELGWKVLPCKGTSEKNVPVLKWMFQHAISEFQSSYYGYANGDILFNAGLTKTLSDLSEVLRSLPSLLIIGARTDCRVDKCLVQITSHQRQQQLELLTQSPKLRQRLEMLKQTPEVLNQRRPEVRNRRAEVVLKSAQDYFLTTRNGFDWRTIPEFVIGRAGYDNWIVVSALVRGVAVIDASGTIKAWHQMIEGESHSSHLVQPETNDSRVNYDLAGRGFDYSVGVMDCATMETVLEGGGGSEGARVVLRQRELSRYCKRNLVMNHRIRPSSLVRHRHWKGGMRGT